MNELSSGNGSLIKASKLSSSAIIKHEKRRSTFRINVQLVRNLHEQRSGHVGIKSSVVRLLLLFTASLYRRLEALELHLT